MFFCILLFFTLFFLHFLSSLYWQCMLLHVIFGILHHSFLIVCVLGSLPFTARRQILSFTICRILYPRKHKCRCIQQRHLNKERNFSAANPSYVLKKLFSSSLIYTVYQIFRCMQIFVGFFCRQQKKRRQALFQIRKLFSFVFFLMYSSAYALALTISAASICGINLSIVLAVMISFFRN